MKQYKDLLREYYITFDQALERKWADNKLNKKAETLSSQLFRLAQDLSSEEINKITKEILNETT